MSQLVFAAAASADSPAGVSDGDRQLGEYLWAGVMSERERLKTGVVHISGTLADDDGSDSSNRARVPTVDLTFDHGVGKSLYLIGWPDRRGIWMKTPDGVYGWSSGSEGIIEIQKETDPHGTYVFAPDVRLLGISGLRGIRDGNTLERRDKVLWEKLNFHSTRRTRDGVYEVSWTKLMHDGSQILVSIVINEAKGFTTEGRTIRGRRNRSIPWDEIRPLFWVRAKWESRGGTWVPVSAETEETRAGPWLALTLEWQSVNEPVADTVFDVENLGIPKQALIVDSRLHPREGIIVGKVGEPEYVPPSTIGKLKSPERRRSARFVFWATAGLGLVIIVMILARRLATGAVSK